MTPSPRPPAGAAPDPPQAPPQAPPARPTHLSLRVLAGQPGTSEIPLPPDEPLTLAEGVEIQPISGLHLLRATPEANVFVSGIPVQEKILEPGDVIAVGDASFEVERGGLHWHTRLAHIELQTWVILIAFALALLLVVRSVEQLSADRARLAEGPRPTPPPPTLIIPPSGEPFSTDPETRLLQARALYQSALEMEADASVDLLNLFWAMQQWQRILDAFATVQPPPDIVQLSRQRLDAARERFSTHLRELQANAILAFKSGRKDDFNAIVAYLIRIVPDPENPYFQWAQKMKAEYGNN
ncbi:MAG: hypothetical protein SNJ84_10000 [Verrucomicrobiia bacterium]